MTDRIGEEKTNNFGSKIVIKEYRGSLDIDVYFPEYNWTKEHVQYDNFIKGKVKCPYERRFYNKGYLGEGIYKTRMNNKYTKYYSAWFHMLQRCYDPKFIEKHPTYEKCEICTEWHNFQVFSEWLDKNYYKIEGERMNLDKDILCKRNKIYSPDTCVFVPQRINSLFIKSDRTRGNFPVGVSYCKANKRYITYCKMNGKQNFLGYYDTPNEAFQVYKQYKEQYIKEVAEEYKNVIPQKLYEAMLRYEVDIDD